MGRCDFYVTNLTFLVLIGLIGYEISCAMPRAGLALVAGQRSMHVGAAEYPHPRGVAFELVGVDFLVDSNLRPWLLEFNAVPSMARQVTAKHCRMSHT